MPDRPPGDLPAIGRALFWIGERIVPGAQRVEWLRRWRLPAGDWWAVLVQRKDVRPEAYGGLFAHCRAAISDAFWLRVSRDGLRKFSHSPQFLLLFLAVLWIAIASGSGGFSRLRRILGPLPYADAGRLVLVSQVDSAGQSHGIPRSQIQEWERQATSISAIAGFRDGWGRAWVTPNLTSMLGIKPVLGRTLRPEDPPSSTLITDEFWRRVFDRDPGVVGRHFEWPRGYGAFTVVGVLPPNLLALPEGSAFWTSAPAESAFAAPAAHNFTAIARLKPGVTPASAMRELERLAHSDKVWLVANVPVSLRVWLVANVRVSPWKAKSPLPFYAVTLGFGIAIGLILAAVSRQAPVVGHITWRRAVRAWGFLLVKIFVLLAGITVGWIEAVAVFHQLVEPSELRTVFTLGIGSWGFVFVCALAVLWCFADQRRRCPVCFYRLTMPVTIGSWSSPLLEPVTTEFVCEQGHGSLCLPETQSSTSEPDHWTAMDDSWRDLFTRR